MNLNFHQTFKPEKQYLIELLMLADNCFDLTKEEISYATGIPQGKSSGKVLPHLEYAKYMGLIDYSSNKGKYTIKLTDLGDLVKDEDIGLSEELTILLLHAMLVRKINGADLWNFVFQTLPYKYGFCCMIDNLKKEANDYFITSVNITPFKSSYEDLFSELNIVSFIDDRIFINETSINNQYIYLYAYILFEYWELNYPNQNEISANELQSLCFRNTFGWSFETEYNVLEQLASEGLIRFNKQLIPYTVLKLVDKDILLDKLYSKLF